jgi:hypothetical protein
VTLATVGPWTLKERCSVSAVIRKAGTMVLSADAQPIVSVAFSLFDDSAGRCALSGTATPAA